MGLVANERVDSARIAIVGASVGANLAYMASGAGWGVRTVVALSGNAENANLLAGKIDDFEPRNVFLVASDGDHGRDAFARNMFEQAGEPRRVEIQENSSAHGVEILISSAELKKAMLDWLTLQLASRQASAKK